MNVKVALCMVYLALTARFYQLVFTYIYTPQVKDCKGCITNIYVALI